MTGAANSSSTQDSDLALEVLKDETAVRRAISTWKLLHGLYFLGVCWSIGGWTCHPNEGSVGKLLK